MLTNSNSFTDDWSFRLKRLRALGDLIFDPETFHARLVRTDGDSAPLTIIGSETSLEENLLKTSGDDFRILSLCQEYSLGPLLCTERAIMQIVQCWGISAMFLDVLLKFGDQPQVFEESSGFRQAFQYSNGSFELCYQLMYVEPSCRPSPRDPWSFRQTGVEHKYESDTNQSWVLVLHPNDESVLQGQLEKCVSSSNRSVFASHPLNVHLMIVSTYMSHWQEHIESLAQMLNSIRKHIMVIDTDESTFKARELQNLRNIEDKISCKACRCLKSTMQLVRTLKDVNDSLSRNNPAFEPEPGSMHQQLTLIEHRLEGHINAAELLAERVQATLGLLTNILDLQNQANSDHVSKRMLRLTRDSVDDNATVKVITVCTLVYLPASFMATFFGMNIFDFGPEVGGLRASPYSWVYVATTVPLTLLTVGGWYLFKLQHDKKRKKKRDEEEEAE